MGKVSKRQRKFLSKNILPHKKKATKRALDKKKDDNNKSAAGKHTAQEPQHQQQRAVKTLPEGVNVAAFLQCPWLDVVDAGQSERDTCVARFEPTAELLNGLKTAAAPRTTNKERKSSATAPTSGISCNEHLTEQAVRTMIDQAVEMSSIDDLLRLVWALQIAREEQLHQSQQTASSESTKTASKKTEGPVSIPVPGARAHALLLGPQGLGRLHLAFRAHLGPEQEEGSTLEEWEEAARGHRQLLEKSDAWPALGGALLSFLVSALDTLESTVVFPGYDTTGNEDPTPARNRADAKKDGGNKNARLLEGLAMMRTRVPLLFPFPRLARRHLIFLLGLLETNSDPAVVSLAFVRLYDLATSQPMPFLHDAFKGVYRSYRAAAERIGALARGEGGGLGAGTSAVLPLLRECIAELFGVEKPSAYLHTYVYIHDLVREAGEAAAEEQRGGGKTRETGPARRRLRSWGFLQSLLLWTSVVAAHPSKTSLGPLVPPLAKVLEITLQLSPGLHGAPRTLAAARAAQDLAAAAGIYFPTSHYLLGLLERLHPPSSCEDGRSCPTGGKPNGTPRGGVVLTGGEKDAAAGRGGGEEDNKTAQHDRQDVAGRGGTKGINGGQREGGGIQGAGEQVDLLAGVAGLSKEELRWGPVHAAVSRKAVNLIAREAACYRWSAGLPELCEGINLRLARLLEGGCLAAEEGGGGRCRVRVRWLQGVLGKASAEALARRTLGSKHPGDAGPIDTFRGMEEPTATQRLFAFKENSG